MLLSEAHFTDKNYLNINGYKFYHTQHPSGKAHGSTGIIIKSNIKHYELPPFQKDYLQATNVAIEDCHGTITTSAVLRHEACHRLYFLTVARGPTMSQSDRFIWPPDHIQCIEGRIAVAKQRVLETSNFVRYVFHARIDIRDHRRERWRDLSRVGVVLKMRQWNHLKSVSSLWHVERYTLNRI